MIKSRYFLLGCLLCLISSCSLFQLKETPATFSQEKRDSLMQQNALLRDSGRVLRERSALKEALEVQSHALQLSLMLHDTISIVKDYNQLGTTFRRLGRLDNAIQNHYQALLYAEQRQDTSRQALKNLVVSCNGLGNVHLSQGNDEIAEAYFRRALSGEQSIGSHLGLAINYANLGSIMQHRMMLDSALWYFGRSMDENIELGSVVGQSLCHMHYGEVYELMGDLEKAETELRNAVDLIADDADRWHAAEAILALADNLYKQNRLDEAQEYADRLLVTAYCLHSFQSLRDACEMQARLAEARNDVSAALDYYKQTRAWGDSISNSDSDKSMQQLCIDYEIARSRQQVDELQRAYDTNVAMHHIIDMTELALFCILLIALLTMVYALHSRKEKLEALHRLDSMRNTFLSNLTHEFRTPLTVIIGLANQLKIEDVPVEQRNHLLDSVTHQGRTLLNLVNQLLGISKMMAGYEQCEWRHGNVVAFVRRAVSDYADFAEMRNIELHTETAEDQITMDFVPDYYQKIVSNLLGNAFKHTASGGSITVRMALRQNHFIMEVSDTGEGISPEDLPHIFEVFYQGVDAKRQGSTGLGLPYVKQMVRQMGGIITAENNMPHGTTIHITLGLQCNTPEKAGEIKPWVLTQTLEETTSNTYHEMPDREMVLAGDDDRPLVLIVEDNPDISDYIALLLHSHYRVVKAGDGYAALRVVTQHLPDIILSDLMMPGMDGYELCLAIRQSPVLSDVPLVMISAKSEDTDRTSSLEFGPDAYLVKPFNPEELQRLISQLLERRDERRARMRQLVQGEVNAEGDDTFIQRINYAAKALLLEGKLQKDTVAEQLGMSRSALSKTMASLTGTPPSAYLLQYRIDAACRLLKQTALSLNDIALQCGFEDVAFFGRVFKQNMGVSPAIYRES